ncbi:putative Na+/H+ antiporter [Candidatus Chlamydia sanziniae]|uniref:Putative membrane protein n=1 Tax=Candidatus Chlamydia sanziniae TaxID=1806891 RepID=A0A1A9HUS2_9CHLA|nr:putative Na+/H+ antiporter [Candidatus Chlamydia sanziniae]ANH78750.1 putative membrane protein [Candidatus Chlamydia sanziniae]
MILPPYSTSLKIGATALFFCSIFHTFLTPWLHRLCQSYEHKKLVVPEFWKHYAPISEFYRLVSKVEIVFCLWSVPLFCWFLYTEGYRITLAYFNSRNYSFAVFVMVILVLLESRPIVYLAERLLSTIAKIGRTSPKSWWWTLMIATPLLSALLKETGAMIIGATLLMRHFYIFSPSRRFAYATMGLLFSNISIGGLTSSMSSRALFIILPSIKWKCSFLLQYFSWKAIIAILVATAVYYLIFRKEFDKFPEIPNIKHLIKDRIPWWIICTHIILVSAILLSRSNPLFMTTILLFYLGFRRFTIFYQEPINIPKVCFVGLFYAGLVIFGDLQEWWVLNLMQGMSDFGYMLTSYGLSIFLDNALVNYLVHNLPVATDCYLYLVITGCMAAGGLTLVSNIPNIIGYLILKPAFRMSSIHFGSLFLAALVPSIIALTIFWLLRNIPEFVYCFFR